MPIVKLIFKFCYTKPNAISIRNETEQNMFAHEELNRQMIW